MLKSEFQIGHSDLKAMSQPSRIKRVLEQLAGQAAPFSADLPEEALQRFKSLGAGSGTAS